MRPMVFALIVIPAVLLIPTAALAKVSELSFHPVETAYVDSFFPDESFPKPDYLEVAYDQTGKLSFLRFDLSNLPQEAHLEKATFSAFMAQGEGEEVSVEILTPFSPWCSDKLTWNTKPPLALSSTSSASLPKPGLVVWDVTSLVNNWLINPKENKGFALSFDRASFTRRFTGSGKNSPLLFLTLAEPIEPISIPLATASGWRQDDSCQILGVASNSRSSDKQMSQLTTNSFSTPIREKAILFLLVSVFTISSILIIRFVSIRKPKAVDSI